MAITIVSSIVVSGGLIAFAAILLAGHHGLGGQRTPASPPVTLGGGKVVYQDDFGDAASGWISGSIDPGTSATYADASYVVQAGADGLHSAPAPYNQALSSMAVSVNATEVSGDPLADAYGIGCDHPSDSTSSYTFLVFPSGDIAITWYASSGQGSDVYNGTVALQGIGGANDIAAACIMVGASNGSATTRLMLSVNGKVVADTTDTITGSAQGWLASLIAASSAGKPSQVAFRHFAIRDLGGGSGGTIGV